ncbi:hypothetical protein [Maricaulis sp.]|uniref:hypothetical protein n=1 Tax=Maricaulis sp. TaxID=1486257 RepID=UPI003A8E6E3A
MSRSVPLSVRISDDDAAFLARFKAEGAKTPSEKLRALLAQARRMEAGGDDFASRVEWCGAQLQPALNRLRNAQKEHRNRSELVARAYQRMPELVATLMVGVREEGTVDDLVDFEADLSEQIFALIEELLDLGLTENSRTFDPELMKRRLEPIQEILDLVRLSKQPKGGNAP